MRMMRLPAVWTTNLVALLFGAAMFAAYAFLPQLCRLRGRGYGFGASVTDAGLLMLPMLVAMAVAGSSGGSRLVSSTSWLGPRSACPAPLACHADAGGRAHGRLGLGSAPHRPASRALLDDVRRDHAGLRVLLVAHDSVVLMLRHLIEGLSLPELEAIVRSGPVVNASITRWTGDTGRLVLAEYNTVTHLPGE